MNRLIVVFVIGAWLLVGVSYGADSKCKLLNDKTLVADTLETLLMAHDMLKNKETSAVESLAMMGRVKAIPKRAKVTIVDKVVGYPSFSKIREYNQTQIWVCPNEPLYSCD